MLNGAAAIRPDTLRSFEKSGVTYGIYTLGIETPPISLESTIAVELTQQGWKQRTVIKRSFPIRDFSLTSLGISTANLTLRSSDGACSSILDPFVTYRREELLCLTYEIYNLAMADTRARYRLTYSIKKAEEERSGIMKALAFVAASVRGERPDEEPYIVNSIEQSANDNTVRDRIQISVGALEAQRYVLSVTVDDLNGGASVTEEQIFTITE